MLIIVKKYMMHFGREAIEKIQENPYVLIDIVYGVSFEKIDKIAIQIGIPQDSDSRIKSGIKYALLVASYNGHTCVLKDNLVTYVKEILNVNDENILNNLINLNGINEIVIENRENEGCFVYLEPLYRAENNIATKLIALKNAKI